MSNREIIIFQNVYIPIAWAFWRWDPIGSTKSSMGGIGSEHLISFGRFSNHWSVHGLRSMAGAVHSSIRLNTLFSDRFWSHARLPQGFQIGSNSGTFGHCAISRKGKKKNNDQLIQNIGHKKVDPFYLLTARLRFLSSKATTWESWEDFRPVLGDPFDLGSLLPLDLDLDLSCWILWLSRPLLPITGALLELCCPAAAAPCWNEVATVWPPGKNVEVGFDIKFSSNSSGSLSPSMGLIPNASPRLPTLIQVTNFGMNLHPTNRSKQKTQYHYCNLREDHPECYRRPYKCYHGRSWKVVQMS